MYPWLKREMLERENIMKANSIDAILASFREDQEYIPGESLSEVSARIDIPPERIVKLNANENLFVPLKFVSAIAREAAEKVDHRLYPGDLMSEVYEKLSNYLELDKDNILLGGGADQLIDLLIALFGKNGITTVHPTFMYYRERCKLYNVPYRYITFNRDLSINIDELDKCLKESSMLILCTPNNPTGHVIPEDIIREVAEEFRGIILLDETYAEFSDIQLHKLPLEIENVIVMRTFSKAFAAASIRLGYIIGSTKVISIVKRFQQPYPVSGFSLKFASLLLDRIEYFKRVWNEVKQVRAWFYKELEKYSNIQVLPSQANFVSFGCNIDGKKVYNEFMKRGYLIRIFNDTLGFKCLVRVTLAPIDILKGFTEVFPEVMNQ